MSGKINDLSGNSADTIKFSKNSSQQVEKTSEQQLMFESVENPALAGGENGTEISMFNEHGVELYQHDVQVGESFTELIKKSLIALGIKKPTKEQIEDAKKQFIKDNGDDVVKKGANGVEYLIAGNTVKFRGEIKGETWKYSPEPPKPNIMTTQVQAEELIANTVRTVDTASQWELMPRDSIGRLRSILILSGITGEYSSMRNSDGEYIQDVKEAKNWIEERPEMFTKVENNTFKDFDSIPPGHVVFIEPNNDKGEWEVKVTGTQSSSIKDYDNLPSNSNLHIFKINGDNWGVTNQGLRYSGEKTELTARDRDLDERLQQVALYNKEHPGENMQMRIVRDENSERYVYSLGDLKAASFAELIEDRHFTTMKAVDGLPTFGRQLPNASVYNDLMRSYASYSEMRDNANSAMLRFEKALEDNKEALMYYLDMNEEEYNNYVEFAKAIAQEESHDGNSAKLHAKDAAANSELGIATYKGIKELKGYNDLRTSQGMTQIKTGYCSDEEKEMLRKFDITTREMNNLDSPEKSALATVILLKMRTGGYENYKTDGNAGTTRTLAGLSKEERETLDNFTLKLSGNTDEDWKDVLNVRAALNGQNPASFEELMQDPDIKGAILLVDTMVEKLDKVEYTASMWNGSTRTRPTPGSENYNKKMQLYYRNMLQLFIDRQRIKQANGEQIDIHVKGENAGGYMGKISQRIKNNT